MKHHHLDHSYEARLKRNLSTLRWNHLHIDPILLLSLIALSCLGVFILFSASNSNPHVIEQQALRLGFSFIMMVIIARLSPQHIESISPLLYSIGLILLILTPFLGHSSQGARRWIGIGSVLIQPSEIMKLAMPMMIAWLLKNKTTPLKIHHLFIAFFTILIPTLLVIKQPDLGTAIIIALSGLLIILLAGVNRTLIISSIIGFLISLPIAWHFLHTYQKERILTFMNPNRDPLGSGYNIIQSKIAVGSGGLLGKGWLKGTQSHLSFLPAHKTDFIFSVAAEELGFLGALLIIGCISCVFLRCLLISLNAQTQYTRLLAASLSLSFIFSAFINIGMVIGIVPVVGIPLPLISYGGSSMITTMIGFGIIMSIQSHKKLWST